MQYSHASLESNRHPNYLLNSSPSYYLQLVTAYKYNSILEVYAAVPFDWFKQINVNQSDKKGLG